MPTYLYIPHRDVMKEWWCLTWHFLSGACLCVCVINMIFSFFYDLSKQNRFQWYISDLKFFYHICENSWFIRLIFMSDFNKAKEEEENFIYFSPSMRICAETFRPHHNLFNKYNLFAGTISKAKLFRWTSIFQPQTKLFSVLITGWFVAVVPVGFHFKIKLFAIMN